MKKTISYIFLIIILVGTIGLYSCDNFIVPDQNHQHTWTEEVVAPTCSSGGYTQKICSGCDMSMIVNETEPTGIHTYNVTEHPANCTTPSYKESVCSVCSHRETEVIGDVLGDHENKYSFDSSVHWEECILCGETGESLPHTLDSNSACTVCDYEPKTYTITISSANFNVELLQKQIEDFNESQAVYKIIAELVQVYPGDIIAGNADVPDLFLYDSSETAKLVSMGLLASQSGSYADKIINNNLPVAVDAASHNNTIYGYPLSIGNTYILFYDKSVISNPESLEDIIADCEKSDKLLRFETENMWYISSFFNATGCYTNWITDEKGNFIDVESNYNSSSGITALLGIKQLFDTDCRENRYSTSTSDFAAIISDEWEYHIVQEAFGDNLGIALLPSFTVDGESYPLTPFINYNTIGVKPQEDANLAACLSSLAAYLSSEKCQKENHGWPGYTPTNLSAMADSDILANDLSKILIEQAKSAVAQKSIYPDWWGMAVHLTSGVKNEASNENLQAALEEYDMLIEEMIQKENAAESWSVIGELNGSTWDIDFPLTKSADGYWISERLYIRKDGQFKIRKNNSWSEAYFGENGLMGVNENLVAPNSGYFRIKFRWDGVSDTADIQIIVEELVELPDPSNPEESTDCWSIIGTLGGTNWDKDFNMTGSLESGFWYAYNITLNKGDQIKFRFAGNWDINIGSRGDYGGDNIIISESGTYSISLSKYPDADKYEISFSNEEGYTVDPTENAECWSVIGTMQDSNWDKDFFMTKDEDGFWVSDVIHFESGDEFKIRKNENWGWNFGKHGAPSGENIVVRAGGDYRIRFSYSIHGVSAYIAMERQDESHSPETVYSFSAEELDLMSSESKNFGDIINLNDYFNLYCNKDTSIVDCNTTFTMEHSSSRKIMLYKSPTRKDGMFANCIGFSTSKTVTIRVWWESEGDNGQLGLYNSQNDLIASINEWMPSAGHAHISEFTCFDPGEYYIGIRYNKAAPLSIHKIEVIESNHPDLDTDYICDVPGCGLVVPPAEESHLTFAQANLISASKYSNEFTCGRYHIKGKIIKLDTTYGDMTIQDEEGNTFYIYGSVSSDGFKRYDAIPDGEKPVLGDTVTLLGTIGNYNGLFEMRRGYIIEYSHE